MSADRRDKKKLHGAGPFKEHTAPDDYGPPQGYEPAHRPAPAGGDGPPRHEPPWGYETSGGGYGKPPYEPPVLEGQGGRQCDLHVVIFGAENADAKLADGSPRLAGVEVTIRSGKYTNTQHTDEQGGACWQNLEAGHYEVTVTPPEHYLKPNPVPVDIAPEKETTVEVPLLAEPAEIEVVAFYDRQGTSSPRGQQPISHAVFEVFQNGTKLGRYETGRQGRTVIPVRNPGTLSVQPVGSLKAGALTLTPASRNRIFVPVAAGERRQVYLPYVARQAELPVEAVVVEEKDGEETTIPLSGVTLSLFPGSVAAGAPLRTLATSSAGSAVFADLQPALYTLRVTAPDKWYGGPLELIDLRNASTVIDLTGGGAAQAFELRFRRQRGKVTGQVCDKELQEGLEGVALVLTPAQGGDSSRAVTGASGEFVFAGVPPGVYHLNLEQSRMVLGGVLRVLADGLPQRLEVKPGKNTAAATIRLTADEHLLTVHVLDENGAPLPHAEVTLRDEWGQRVGTYTSDPKGQVQVHLLNAGNYSVILENPERVVHPVYVNHPAQITVQARGGRNPNAPGGAFAAPGLGLAAAMGPGGFQGGAGGFGAGRFGGGGFPLDVDIPYPVLSEGGGGGSWGASGGTSAALAAPGVSVEGALREVLGWRPRTSDPKGFLAALNQAFDIKQVEGHHEFTWNQRSYAVQHEMGAITGAQASLYSRARAALDQMLPLLEGLTPLRADADEQDLEAARSIVKSEVEELVAELGVEGGPRVARVDTLFDLLLGPNGPINPAQVPGQLGQLQQVFGFQRNRINTVEEEQNFTNFLILLDHLTSLRQSWNNQRAFFTRAPGNQPFFGTQLVLVSRALGVVAESVHEVYRAMDSVFLGPAERQVVELTFAGGPPLFVSELLSWVEQAATDQGPRLLKEGGRAGAVAFLPTLVQLEQLVRDSLTPPQNPNNLPAGYRTARVQRALQELAEHLDETGNLVRQI